MILIDLWQAHQASILAVLVIAVLVAISNSFSLKRLDQYPPPAAWPKISVLIPARNEEENIGGCVLSLLKQQYPDFEIWVLDDSSTDRTGEILAELASISDRLRVLKGAPLPDGWLGKHWACQQLSQAAEGELLLFTDADTTYHPYALREMAAASIAQGADLLAVIPQERVVTPAEKLVVPFFLWAVMAFLPVWLAGRVRWPGLSFAIGQCMLFRREALERVGGFAAVRDHAVDDLALARRIKAAGLRWRAVDGVRRVECRMYHNWGEVIAGFSKNAFASFDYNITVFVLAWVGMAVVFLEPVIVMLLPGLNFAVPDRSLYLALVAVLLSLGLWLAFCRRFRFPMYLAFFYPITILLYTLIAFRSLFLTLAGEPTWKDRKLEKKRVKII